MLDSTFPLTNFIKKESANFSRSSIIKPEEAPKSLPPKVPAVKKVENAATMSKQLVKKLRSTSNISQGQFNRLTNDNQRKFRFYQVAKKLSVNFYQDRILKTLIVGFGFSI